MADKKKYDTPPEDYVVDFESILSKEDAIKMAMKFYRMSRETAEVYIAIAGGYADSDVDESK